jgi:KEOPS complex subunit Pcc1
MKEARANIEVNFDSEEDANIIFRAIGPEVRSTPSDKAHTKIELEGNKLMIEISAKDAAAFRAAINTYYRWLKVSKSIMEVSRWSNYQHNYSTS